MFKSLVFARPFGTHLEHSYGHVAAQLVEHAPVATLWTLGTQRSLVYAPGNFARRGALWWDGECCGSVFPTPLVTRAFFPPFKSRYRGVPPFILSGFAHGTPAEAFVVCDLCVWNNRGVLQEAPEHRNFLLRMLLATLVDKQPAPFLKERRIRLAEFLPLPQSVRSRRKLTDSGIDLYVVDAANSPWRVWCPFWLDTWK